MIRLELEIGDLDIDRLAERYLPQLRESDRWGLRLLGRRAPTAVLLRLLRRIPQEKKERLLVSLINKNTDTLLPLLEGLGEQAAVAGRITSARIETKEAD